MTTSSPTVAPAWDENRLREVLRNHKPLTPRLKAKLEHLNKCALAYHRAHAEYAFEAAMTGAADCSRLRVTIRRLAIARHDALTALDEDPATSEIFPAVPIEPPNA